MTAGDRTADLRVAYVASAYPKLSHAFIQREIQALRRRGVRIDTYTLREAPPGEVLSPDDVEEARATRSLQPVDWALLLRAHVRALVRHPRAYASTFARAARWSRPGLRGRLWGLFYFAEAILLFSMLRRRTARHVHAHFANAASNVVRLTLEFARRAEPRAGWTWSFTMHGSAEFHDVQLFDLGGKVGHADLVVCISDFCRAQLMMSAPPDAWAKLRVIHCGADLETFRPGTTPPNPPLRVLHIGRLMPVKGQTILVEAIAAARAVGVDVSLTIVGGGPEEGTIRRTIDRLGLSRHVHLVGPLGQDEIARRYHEAHVFCLSSFDEGVPVVLMEAMACAIPVIAPRVGGVSELVVDRETGWLVTPGRADQIAEALVALARDPALRARLGGAGRTFVVQGFDADEEAAKLVEAFRGVVAGSPR